MLTDVEEFTSKTITEEDVLSFWFVDHGPDDWFKKSEDFDTEIKARFEGLYQLARSGQLNHWSHTPRGVVALVIILDQFSRNMYRGSARAFESDTMALVYARRAIRFGLDQMGLSDEMRQFLYMPFEHSEEMESQIEGVRLMGTLENPDLKEWALRHMQVINEFGRFPHRNSALGRESTHDEVQWLQDNGGF